MVVLIGRLRDHFTSFFCVLWTFFFGVCDANDLVHIFLSFNYLCVILSLLIYVSFFCFNVVNLELIVHIFFSFSLSLSPVITPFPAYIV